MQPKEPYIIRNSILRLVLMAIFTGYFTIGLPVESFIKGKNFFDHLRWGVMLWLLLMILFIYCVVGIIKRHAQIILSSEGISLRDEGDFLWAEIQAIEIRKYETNGEELVLYLSSHKKIKFNTDLLETTLKELSALIQEYNTNPALGYRGINCY